MQKQMQQLGPAERQPFFKPLNTSIENNNTNLFSYDQTKLRTQETPPRQANTSATFFAPLSQKQKEHEMNQNSAMGEKTSSDRLSDLHTKLHSEAEKIRKWKVQTEIEIKQKDRKIQELTSSIDSLRKSVLELQMQNESVGMKLKEELDNREEIVQKINATRDICNLLKEHTTKVEKKLQSCETERLDLRVNEKENVKNLEELSKQFTLLDIQAKESHNNLIGKLQLEHEEKVQMTTGYEARLNEAEALLNSLQQSYQEKEQEITIIRSEMNHNLAHIQQLMAEQAILGQKLNEASTLAVEQKEHINKVTAELEESNDSKMNLEAELGDTQTKLQETITSKEKMAKNFDDTEKLYIEKVKSLKETQAQTVDDLDKERCCLSELETKLKKAQASIEELKSSKDMLILEKTEAQDQKKELEAVQEQLKREIEELNEKYSYLSEEHTENQKERLELEGKNSCLQATIDALNEQIITLTNQQDVLSDRIKAKCNLVQEREAEIYQLKEELKDALHREKTCYEKLDQLKEQLNTKSDENLMLCQQFEDLNDDYNGINKDLKNSKKDNTKLMKDLEKLSKTEAALKEQLAETKQQVAELREEIERLEAMNKEKEENTVNLMEQGASTTKNLQDELSTKQKRTESLDTQVKNLKSDMTEKNKKIKELEKDLKTTRGKLTSSTKSFTKLETDIESLSGELAKAAETKEELQDKIKDIDTSLKRNNEEVEKMKKENNELNKTTNKAVKDKEKACKEFEAQMAKMMSTLEKYNKDNQKIVEQKDKELELVKTQAEKKSNKEHKEEITVLKNQIEELNISLKTKEVEKDEEIAKLSKVIECLKQETEDLKVEKMEWSKTKEDEAINLIKKTKPASAKVDKSMLQEVPRTPVVRKTPVMVNTVTPQFSYRTPQRSILKRQPDSEASKKRRVIFANTDDDVSGAESSSSELMEVDMDEIETRLKVKTPQSKSSVLPLHLRPSPKVSQNTVVAHSPKVPAVQMKPVPRGQASWQKKPNKAEKLKATAEKEYVFPDDDQNVSLYNDDGSKKNKIPKSAVVRKTGPNKGGRKLQALREKKQENLSWFDSDNVFGFDMED